MTDRAAQLLAAAGLVWLIVAVISAGAAPDRETLLGTDRVNLIVNIVLLALWLSLVAFALFLRAAPRRTAFEPPARRSRWSMALVLVVAWLFALWRPDFLQRLLQASEQVETEPPPTGEAEPDVPVEVAPPETSGDVTDLLLIIALGIVVAGWLWWRAKRSDPDDSPTHIGDLRPTAADLDTARREAATALRSPARGPRAAVLTAYEALEALFTDHRLPRAAAETPSEHLARATGALGVTARPFEDLCRLYERARFSVEEITADDVARAADRLEASSATLRSVR